MIINMRYVFVLFISIMLPKNILNAMTKPAAPDDVKAGVSSTGSPTHGLSVAAIYAHQAGLEPGDPMVDADIYAHVPVAGISMDQAVAALNRTDNMRELYSAIDRADEKDLVIVQTLVSQGFNDDYFNRPDLRYKAAYNHESPFWYALRLLVTETAASPQYPVRCKMLPVLAGVYPDSKNKLVIGKNIYGVGPLHYVVNVSNPKLELVRILLENKICDPNCFNASGNSVVIDVKNRDLLQVLLDGRVIPLCNWSTNPRPDKVRYFVIRFNGDKWVIERARTSDEVARVIDRYDNGDFEGCCRIL